MANATIRSPNRMVLFAVIAGLGALLMLAPPATAKPCQDTAADIAFVTYLENHGIFSSSGPCGLVAVGHRIASDIDNHVRTPVQEAIYVYNMTPESISLDDAALMVGAALGAYAPWDEDLLTGGSTGGNRNA